MALSAGKVYMEFDDGTKGWVPSNKVRSALSDGGKITSVRLRSPGGQERDVSGTSAARLMAAGATEVPAGQEQPGRGLGGAVLGNLRSSAAAIPVNAAGMAPALVPGAGLGSAAARTGLAFGAGAGADMASRGIMGQPQDVGGSALAGGINAAVQVPFEGASALLSAVPKMFAKSALGSAIPGMERLLLKARTPISESGMEADKKFIADTVAKARNTSFKSDKTFSADVLEREIARMRDNAAKSDLLSEGSEASLDEALKVLRTKMDRYYTPEGRPSVERPLPKKKVRLTTDQVDDINQYAENAAKKLYEARMKNQVADPGPLEQAYMRIAKLTNSMLNTVPEVRALNAAASERIALKNAKFDALKRSHSGGLSALLGSAVALPAAAAHSPLGAATGIGIGAAHYAATSPELMSRAAIALDRPYLSQMLLRGPRLAGTAVVDAMRRNQNQ